MNFTDNNPLSMTGEDSFTSINEILARCVLIDTNQTILSSKTFEATTTTTFDGDVELNATTDNTGTLNNTGTLIVGGTLNLNTDIVADKASLNFSNTGSTIINPQNIMALQIAGTDKFVTDMMNTAIYATSALNLSAGGLNTIQMTSATFQSNFSTQQLFSVNSNQKLQLQNTNTNLNNTTTSIQSGGTTKIQVGASTTTLNNTTTEIQSGGTNRVTIDGTTTAMNNTNTNIQSGGTDRVTINATITTLNNDTTKIQSGGIDKIDINSTTTTFQDNTINMLVANPLTKINFSSGSYGLDILGLDKISVTDIISVFENTTTEIRSGGSSKITTNATTTTLNNTATSINSGAVVKYLQNATDTTLSNDYHYFFATTENRFRVGGVDKEVITSSATTLTNTAINLTALGTTGAITLTGGGSASNIGINLDSVGDVKIDSDNDIRISGSSDVFIQVPAGSSRATFTSGTTSLSNTTSLTMNHPTTTIQSSSSAKLTIGGSDTTLTNTGDVLLQSTGTSGSLSISANNNSTEGILLQQNGTGGVRILSSTTSPLIMGTGTTNYASVSSAGVGATEYWVGSGGANSFPLSYPLMWMTSATTGGHTTTQCRVGSFPDNNTSETFIRYRFPFRSRVRAMTLISDGETINANQTYVHISVTNTTGLDASPNYAYWIYDAGAGGSDVVATDNGSMTSVADIPANSTFYVFVAFGSAGSTINVVGTARSVPAEFQVHLWIQQVI
jgi:hypothetical protein